MADYKLSLTAEEIEKKLSMCTLPMVEIADKNGGIDFALTDAESAALDEAFNTGLPCVIARRCSSGEVETSVAQRYERDSFAIFWLREDHYEYVMRNNTTSKWDRCFDTGE